MTIALTGATGHIGRLVAERLADLHPVLLARDPARVTPAEGQEVRAMTYADGPACEAALAGVSTVLMVSAAESENRREEHRTFIAAAARAGVGTSSTPPSRGRRPMRPSPSAGTTTTRRRRSGRAG